MIKDKETKKDTTEVISVGKEVIIPEEVSENPFVNMYEAVRRTLLTLRENPENPLTPPYFKTIRMDNGQFERIIRSDNMEYETAFPAVFIHFTNVRYLVQQQRLGEGRATMRIRFILNNLNNGDDGMECEPFRVFQRINVAIQDAKSYEPALNVATSCTSICLPPRICCKPTGWITKCGSGNLPPGNTANGWRGT